MRATRCTVNFVVLVSAILALLSLAYVFTYAQAKAVSVIWDTFLTMFLVRSLMVTYIEFFKVLFRHRKYESKNFHGSLEIPLSIVVILSLLLLVIYQCFWSVISFLVLSAEAETTSCLVSLQKKTCKMLLGE